MDITDDTASNFYAFDLVYFWEMIKLMVVELFGEGKCIVLLH